MLLVLLIARRKPNQTCRNFYVTPRPHERQARRVTETTALRIVSLPLKRYAQYVADCYAFNFVLTDLQRQGNRPRAVVEDRVKVVPEKDSPCSTTWRHMSRCRCNASVQAPQRLQIRRSYHSVRARRRAKTRERPRGC